MDADRIKIYSDGFFSIEIWTKGTVYNMDGTSYERTKNTGAILCPYQVDEVSEAVARYMAKKLKMGDYRSLNLYKPY